MRGGLDDALDKLARRDELRRRAAGEAIGTPPPVTELVEAIAAVVARNPDLGVTVGVEGAGEPVLLHFYFADGQVQVNADNAVAAARPTDPPAAPRHADFDMDLDETADEPYRAPSAYPAPPGEEATTQRLSQDDQDRYGPATFGHQRPDDRYFEESDTAERRYGTFDGSAAIPEPRYAADDLGEPSRDLGARMRDLGMTDRAIPHQPAYEPLSFAATPPPQTPPTTRRIHPEQYRASAQPPAAGRVPQPAEQRGGMPAPLPKPIPLRVERPEETEVAARRLAALLRDDPTLLNQIPE